MTIETRNEWRDAICPECGESNATHYSGSTEREGKRLGISKHNPFPAHINVNIPDSPLHALEKALASTLGANLDAALAAERRATVERIQQRIAQARGMGALVRWALIVDILDEEASR